MHRYGHQKFILPWAQGFNEFVCDVGRLDLTNCRECGTKIIDDAEENQALVNTITAPFVRYKEVCCLTIGMTVTNQAFYMLGVFFM